MNNLKSKIHTCDACIAGMDLIISAATTKYRDLTFSKGFLVQL